MGRFRARVWSGLRSTILEINANLLDQFDTRSNTALAERVKRLSLVRRRAPNSNGRPTLIEIAMSDSSDLLLVL
jgi:hypothetical protein